MKTLLISQAEIQEYCQLSNYLNSKYIEPHILDVQYLRFKNLIGNDFYTELIEQVEASALTYENSEFLYGNDVTFFGITPYLCWLAFQAYLQDANFISTQSGIRKRRAETSENATEAEMNAKIKLAGEKVELYENDVTVYLIQNKESFPLVDTYRFQAVTSSVQGQVSAIKSTKYANWLTRSWSNWV